VSREGHSYRVYSRFYIFAFPEERQKALFLSEEGNWLQKKPNNNDDIKELRGEQSSNRSPP
jgi:hypothetical protein